MAEATIKSRNESVKEFTKETIQLIKYVGDLFKNAPVARLLNAITVGKRMDHEVVITSIGPYLFKYRTMIILKDGAGISLADIKSEIKGREAQDYEQLIHEIFRVLLVEKTESFKPHREHMYAKLHQLLELYLNFAQRCRYEDKA